MGWRGRYLSLDQDLFLHQKHVCIQCYVYITNVSIVLLCVHLCVYCIVGSFGGFGFWQFSSVFFIVFYRFFTVSPSLLFLLSLSPSLFPTLPLSPSHPPSPSPGPMAPVNFWATKINFTSVSLAWDPPDVPNGIITKYHVSISLLRCLKSCNSNNACIILIMVGF